MQRNGLQSKGMEHPPQSSAMVHHELSRVRAQYPRRAPLRQGFRYRYFELLVLGAGHTDQPKELHWLRREERLSSRRRQRKRIRGSCTATPCPSCLTIAGHSNANRVAICHIYPALSNYRLERPFHESVRSILERSSERRSITAATSDILQREELPSFSGFGKDLFRMSR